MRSDLTGMVFLFGAGASKGVGHCVPYSPPLMRDLYDELARYFPNEWGAGSRLNSQAARFRENFEAAFSEIVLTFGGGIPRASSLDILEKQRPLALYFARFKLDATGRDLYSQLLKALRRSGSLQNALFGSLNYDCLLEQAAYGLGLRVDYSCNEVRPNTIGVAKIHGSCNFITERLSRRDRAMLAGPGVFYEVKFDDMPPIDLEERVNQKLAGWEPTQFAVMSQVSPHKEHFVAPAKIQETRNRWNASVASASVVVIVGVSHNANDTHVQDAIKKTTAKILYIGGIAEADKWRETNRRVEHIAERFEQGFDELLRHLGCSRRDGFGKISMLWIASLILPAALFVLLPENVSVFTYDTNIILAKLHFVLILWIILTVMLCVITWRWFQRHTSER